MLRSAVEAQVRRIASDVVLMRYGAALGLVEALTMVWVWLWRGALVAGEPPICWPIFQSCEAVRVLDLTGFSCLVIGVALLGLGASAAFLLGRARLGYWTLLLAGVLKIAIVLLDFRLRRNQHYMAVAVLAVFLFWPYKRDAIRLLIVGFYFAAGLLKFDMDWISGEGLTRPIWFFTGPWLVAACIYVIALEVVVSWGLLVRRDWIFWSSLAQFAVFHVISYSVVGFFYPILMVLLLSIFPLCHGWSATGGRLVEGESLLTRFGGRRLPRIACVPFAIFGLIQVVPYLYPGDSALTGEGRYMALHMFDSLAVCKRDLIITTTSGVQVQPGFPIVSKRIACDPWVLFAHAQTVCSAKKKDPSLQINDVYMKLRSRRSTELELRLLVEEDRVCERGLEYHWWRHNDWIRID